MRFSNLESWLNWQTSLHIKSIDLGLERSAEVWRRLLADDDFTPYVITVAGTNGKGSSVAFLEAILQAGGYRTGCYTSPHLVDYNERIRLDGQAVDDAMICQAFADIDQAREQISLSYFEFGTLAALQIFRQQKPDVVILEVGLGGRLDAVNIIDANAALITGIALDHQDWLGNDRETIGREKAGILRSGQHAVFSGANMPDSIARVAKALDLPLWVAGREFNMSKRAVDWSLQTPVATRHGLPMPMLRGLHQLDNAAGAVALLLACHLDLPLQTEALRRGLINARIAGRFQVLGELPIPTVVDVAHNPQAMAALAVNLQQFVIKGRLHAIVGMLRDKEISQSLSELRSVVDVWHLVPTPGERGLDAASLQQQLSQFVAVEQIHCHEKLADAWQSVLQLRSAEDTLLVAGSFLIAGDFLRLTRELELPE